MLDSRDLDRMKLVYADEIGVLLRRNHKKTLGTSALASCYAWALYFPKERAAALSHVHFYKPMKIFVSLLRAGYPHLADSECEYTVIDGMHPTQFEAHAGNRNPEMIKSYFPNCKPSPYHPLSVSTSFDVVSISKNTGEVKADSPKDLKEALDEINQV